MPSGPGGIDGPWLVVAALSAIGMGSALPRGSIRLAFVVAVAVQRTMPVDLVGSRTESGGIATIGSHADDCCAVGGNVFQFHCSRQGVSTSGRPPADGTQ